LRAEADHELRIGIVGAGWAGREHCTSVAQLGGARIAAVADVDAERAHALSALVAARAYTSFQAMLAAEDLDGVVVATPPGEHRAPAVAALEAGVAVLMEKPIARLAEDAAAVTAAAAAARGICAVAYQWRALDLLDTLRAELAAQPVALLVSQGVAVTQERAWFADPAQSGRLIGERASHHIDLLRAIAGDVVAVQGARGDVALSGRRLRPDARVEDVVSLTLRFASGAIGAVHVGWAPDGYPPCHRCAVFAPESWFDLTLDPEFVLTGRSAGRDVEVTSRTHPWLREMQLFLEAMRRRDPDHVSCTAAQAAESLAVVLAAEQAIEREDAVPVQPLSGVIAASPETATMR
jgi:predicted dehydrogenase